MLKDGRLLRSPCGVMNAVDLTGLMQRTAGPPGGARRSCCDADPVRRSPSSCRCGADRQAAAEVALAIQQGASGTTRPAAQVEP